MPDLTVFLAARLDEEETSAREAADGDSGTWFMGDKWNIYRAEDEAHFDENYQGDEHRLVAWGNVKPQSEHIARHDPSRVLREVAAKRAILAEHQESASGGYCELCYYGYGGGSWPCPTVRALASVYSDHPDYDPEWAVQP